MSFVYTIFAFEFFSVPLKKLFNIFKRVVRVDMRSTFYTAYFG